MIHLPKTYKAAVFEAKDIPLTIKELELKMPNQGEF
jgi:Zn-dependent alcohol dehydrogenase